MTPTDESFKRAWEAVQRSSRSAATGEGVAGPLDLRAAEAGNGRAGSARLGYSGRFRPTYAMPIAETNDDTFIAETNDDTFIF